MKKLLIVLGTALALTRPASAFTSWRTDCSGTFCTDEFKAEHFGGADYVEQQNGLTQIGADLAYETLANYGFTAGQGVTVAIVDSGTLLTHQEFAGKISSLQNLTFQGASLNPASGDHGTHVSGIVAAAKDGNVMHGVAYDASILGITALGETLIGVEGAWKALATDAFDSVKIINNSWGLTDWRMTAGNVPAELFLEDIMNAKALVAKDKLIVASSANDTQMAPSSSAAGLPYYDASLKNNFINVIAYNPNLAPNNSKFLASFTNLAKNAESYSISAPGDWDILSATNTGPTDYDLMGGTSMAAPMVSGAAAVVSSAFPFMGGKQLADTLLSNAYRGTDGNWAGFSKYYVQYNKLPDPTSENKGIIIIRYLIPQGSNASYISKISLPTCPAKYTDGCSVEIYYNDQRVSTDGVNYASWNGVTVPYQTIFGQGLLDLDSAVKGPKTFDANRLTSSDFDSSRNVWFYTVNVNKGQEGIPFAHNITQTKSTTTHTSANVGLKKTGTGELSFAGTQQWQGVTLIENGALKLEDTGVLKGSEVEISANGILKGTGTVESSASVLNNGTLFSSVKVAALENKGGTIYFNSLNDKLTIPFANDLQSGTLDFNKDALESGTFTLLQTTGSEVLNIDTDFILPTYDDLIFYDFAYDRSDAQKVDVTINRYNLTDDIPYTEPLNAQEKNVAKALDTQAANGNKAFNAYYLETEKGIKQKIRRLRTQVQSVSLENLPLANKITNNVYAHLFNISRGNSTPSMAPRAGYRGRSGGTASLDDKIWIQAIGGKAEVKANETTGASKIESTIFGGMAGIDFEVNKNLLVGFTMGYAKTKTRQDDDKIDIHDYRGGLYFSAKKGLFSLNGIVLGGFQEYKGLRKAGASLDLNIGKKYNGWSAEGSLNAGTDLYLYGRPTRGSNRSLFLHVRPYVAGNWQRKYQEGYQETGDSAFILQVENATDTSVTGQAGMMFGIGGQRFEFMLDAGYQRVFKGDIPLVSAYFVSDATQTSFQSIGEEGDKDFLSVGGGFDIRFTDKFALNLWLDNKFSDNTRSHTGTVTLKWFF